MHNITISLEAVELAFELGDIHGDTGSNEAIRTDYTGRGMEGNLSCFGVDLNSTRDAFRFIVGLTIALENLADDDDANPDPYDRTPDWRDAAMSLADRMLTDSMGLGVIAYFPGVTLHA